MKLRFASSLLALTAVLQADVHALTPPGDADGPVRLLNCVVTPNGQLEAEVDNQSDDTMSCNISCGYELGEHRFSHWFEVSIRAHFTGRVGRFQTNGAKPGNYSGEIGSCRKA